MDVANWKSNEWKELLVFAFHDWAQSLWSHKQWRRAELVAFLAYYVRCLTLPDNWFELANEDEALSAVVHQYQIKFQVINF